MTEIRHRPGNGKFAGEIEIERDLAQTIRLLIPVTEKKSLSKTNVSIFQKIEKNDPDAIKTTLNFEVQTSSTLPPELIF